MLHFKIRIDEEAFQDILEITDWYNNQLKGLGSRFQKQVKSQINSLKKNPNIYSKRYDDVHCMVLKKFPFLIHYSVNEDLFYVEIFAVFKTSRNPQIWKTRRK